MPRSRHHTATQFLPDGEWVEVEIALGPVEPAGTYAGGTREVEVISMAGEHGEDLISREDDLDLDQLVEDAMGLEEDALDAAAEDRADADREERLDGYGEVQ